MLAGPYSLCLVLVQTEWYGFKASGQLDDVERSRVPDVYAWNQQLVGAMVADCRLLLMLCVPVHVQEDEVARLKFELTKKTEVAA